MRHCASAVRVLGARCLLVVLVLCITATPSAAGVPGWTTYNHDAGRSATDPDSLAPVPPTPAWSSQPQLDGSIWAQPLAVGSRVYVATENDTVYALDAATGAVVWKRSVGTPVPSQNGTYIGCGDIKPTIGITSTPVVDVAAGRLYAVADTLTGTTVQHRLVALSLADGSPVAGFPVAVDPPRDAPADLLQRASLALSGGRVIVPYGGNDGDCHTYHGWLVSAAENNPASQASFEVASGLNEYGGAIWGGGGAPAVDPSGHLFVSTGNGFSTSSTPDLQESVVELDPSLTVIAHWTASNWKTLDNNDTDLGSAEPLPLPGGLLFQAGKDGIGRLLSATLGPAGQRFSASVCSGQVFGSSLERAGVIYTPCENGLVALRLSTSSSVGFTALPGWSAPSGATGPPVFAAGMVWSAGSNSKTLYALDPTTGAVRFQTTLGTFKHFTTPSAGGGRLFVAVDSKLAAFRISSFPPGTSTSLASSSNPSHTGNSVMLTASVTPAPDGGTVAFTDGGRVLTGCGAVPLAPGSAQAVCHASLGVGTHVLGAGYSGDPYFGASASAPLRQVVNPGPTVTGARLRPRHVTARQGTVLQLNLSEAATVRVTLTRERTARKVHGRCRLGARRGRRCTLSSRPRRETFHGKRGANRFRLNLRRLAPGSYVAKVMVRDANGLGSGTITLRFVISAPRR